MNYKTKISDRVKILLIDEDESIFYLIRRVLQRENYRLYTSTSGRSGMEMSTSICPDLILMDTQLSDMDGIGLIQWFREWTDCPILVVPDRQDIWIRSMPCMQERTTTLSSRFMSRSLRRESTLRCAEGFPGGQGSFYQAGDLKIDFSRRQVSLAGEEIHFSPVEYRILECLALNPGNCGDVSDVVREDMGTVCKQRQPYSAGQYDKYPQEDREDPDGSDVHYHDPACGLPHA